MLVVVMVVVVSIPVYIHYRELSKKIACEQSLDSGTRQLYDAYLMGSIHSVEDAKKHVAYVMDGWEDLCPAYGDIYIVEEAWNEKPYRLVCGLHCEDLKERCRLNAENVFEQIKKRVKELQALGEQYPDAVTVKLNGKELTAVRVESPTNIKYGTNSTSGVKGTVIYFGMTGRFDFENPANQTEGSVCYFNFADEEHGAIWYLPEGFWGSAYGRVIDN